MTTYPLPEL